MICLNLCIREPLNGYFYKTVKTSGSTLFAKEKDLQAKNTIFLENYNLTPLDMSNGLSQVYYINPVGRIDWNTIG